MDSQDGQQNELQFEEWEALYTESRDNLGKLSTQVPLRIASRDKAKVQEKMGTI